MIHDGKGNEKQIGLENHGRRRLSNLLLGNNILDSIEKPENSLESIQRNFMSQSKSFENSLISLENAIDFKKKKYSDFKEEKINELEKEFNRFNSSNDFEKAIVMLKKLIFFDPGSIKFNYIDSSYYSRLGRLYIKQHDLASAIVCYKKALMLNQNDETLKIQLENIYILKGMLKLEEERQEHEDEGEGLFNQFDHIEEKLNEENGESQLQCHIHYLK